MPWESQEHFCCQFRMKTTLQLFSLKYMWSFFPPNLVPVLTKAKRPELTWRTKSLSVFSPRPSGDRVGKPQMLWSLLHLTCAWGQWGDRVKAGRKRWGWITGYGNHGSCAPFHKPVVLCSGNALTVRRFVDEEKEHLSLWCYPLLQRENRMACQYQVGQILTSVS